MISKVNPIQIDDMDTIYRFLCTDKLKNLMFLDIETTGLSAKTNPIILIGMIKITGSGQAESIQLFAERKTEEAKLLEELQAYTKNVDLIITFNGSSFDLPFIQQRCLEHKIMNTLSTVSSFDLYRASHSIAGLLKTANYKQKTLELLIGLQREDQVSGREIIQLYEEFLKTDNVTISDFLFLHNYEDILGMTSIISILSYSAALHSYPESVSFEIHTHEKFKSHEAACELILSGNYNFQFPASLSYQNEGIYLHFSKTKLKIAVPVHNTELKYFYPNYKDYLYLPQEDMAIHKSVGQFVDHAHRKKATAATCYTRKEGLFLPHFGSAEEPLFSDNFKDKQKYIEFDESLFHDPDYCKQYFIHLTQHFSNKLK